MQEKKRYISLDVIKGWGIFSMVLLHALIYQVGQFNSNLMDSLVEKIPIYLLIMFSPLLIISLWGPIFTLITGLNVAHSMTNLQKRNPERLKKYVFQKIIAGLLLVLFSKIAYWLLGSPFIVDNHFQIPPYHFHYDSDTLDSIALAYILVPITLYFLGYRKVKNFPKNIQKPSSRRIYFGLVFISLLWLFISPIISTLIDWIRTSLTQKNFFLIDLFLSKLVTGRFKVFPIQSFAFSGAIIGVALANRESIRKMWNYISRILILFGIILFIYLFAGKNVISQIFSDDIPVIVQLFNIGLMSFAIIGFIRIYDTTSKKKEYKRAERSLFIRRYSIISLTAYVFERFFAHNFYLLYQKAWGSSLSGSGSEILIAWNLWQILLYLFTIFVFWAVIANIWEHANYIFSFEWFLIKVNSIFTKKKHAKINTKKILYSHRIPKEVPII
ncbi:MAG: hypothetical protein ACTSVL_13060 [Promethearchaeota archaeon]